MIAPARAPYCGVKKITYDESNSKIDSLHRFPALPTGKAFPDARFLPGRIRHPAKRRVPALFPVLPVYGDRLSARPSQPASGDRDHPMRARSRSTTTESGFSATIIGSPVSLWRSLSKLVRSDPPPEITIPFQRNPRQAPRRLFQRVSYRVHDGLYRHERASLIFRGGDRQVFSGDP